MKSLFRSPAPDVPPAAPSKESEIREAMKGVIDPEIGLNIVDLGLIYSVRITGRRVDVVMTVTTPGCPMEHSLRFGVETAILEVLGVEEVHVEVTHEPPWNPSMMSAEGRAATGIR